MMLSKHLISYALTAAGLLYPLQILAQDGLKDPLSGESIGDFIAHSSAITNADPLQVSDAVGSVDNAKLNRRQVPRRQASSVNPSPTESDPVEPIAEPAGPTGIQSLGQKAYSGGAPVGQRPLTAVYTKPGGSDAGYNLTLPETLCAETVIGDWESPSGETIKNCTLAQMYQKLSLPSNTLSNYTTTRASNVLDKFNNILAGAVASPTSSPDRALLFRFDPATQEGYWSARLLVITGTIGLIFTGIELGSVLDGVIENLTITEKNLMTAAGIGLAGLFDCMVIRLHQKKYIGHLEAYILNAFIIIGELMLAGLQNVVAGTCAAPGAIYSALQHISQAVPQMLQREPPLGPMGNAVGSTLNLVSQDLESGQHCPMDRSSTASGSGYLSSGGGSGP